MVTLFKVLWLTPPLVVFLLLQWVDIDKLFSPWVLLPFSIWMLATACLVRPASKKEAALYLLVFISLFVVWAIPFTPRKAFILHFQRIGVGDSLPEVTAKLQPYKLHVVADNGTDVEVQIYHEEIEEDSHGRYNADIGVVKLRNGRVIKTEFLPD